jgi:hypothetical protein
MIAAPLHSFVAAFLDYIRLAGACEAIPPTLEFVTFVTLHSEVATLHFVHGERSRQLKFCGIRVSL